MRRRVGHGGQGHDLDCVRGARQGAAAGRFPSIRKTRSSQAWREAEGGAQSGNGGSIDTSGGVLNIAGAEINTSAAHGKTGNWVLDPTDIDIISGGGDPIGGSNIDPNTNRGCTCDD